jgi:hypothetical protein
MAKNDAVIQYCATITALIAISYILIVTNPPSELLTRDNENNWPVYEQLSTIKAMQDHLGSFVIFLAFMGILSFFIGLSMALVYEKTGEHLFSYHLASCCIVLLLGLLLYPYYGNLLASIATAIGIAFYSLGLFYYSPKFRGTLGPLKIPYVLAMINLALILFAVFSVFVNLPIVIILFFYFLAAGVVFLLDAYLILHIIKKSTKRGETHQSKSFKKKVKAKA